MLFRQTGIFLDDEWCAFFKENHFLVGLSLDGIRETNDIYRHAAGCGSVFERIFGAARLLQKHGVDFNILTVVTGIRGDISLKSMIFTAKTA